MINHLVKSTSPYLLQHAGNPVDWYPWSPAALEKARREDKPIFLSIGYAACHWCHVMAHESFEDPDTAAILNARYVSIKVDREERPDLDSIYMSAVMALTGQGGWPMSCFLTPDLQPFYGGTYFPPRRNHGLPAFKDLLVGLSEAWNSANRDDLIRTARHVAAQLAEQSTLPPAEKAPDPAVLADASRVLVEHYDWVNGGWGTVPKFPQPMTIDFLLRRHLVGDGAALKPALHALHAMARGGMYDVVGGGFARYSTDPAWRVPHFEKMLYDNALLVRAYLHAWQVTGDPAFRRVVTETLGFVRREMFSPQGGFASSLDADSAGEEGSFYVWTRDELRARLAEDSGFFETAYGITAAGNWEGKTVLQRAVDDAALASHYSLTVDQVLEKLAGCHARLLQSRAARTRPATDDKVLAAWNGLMLSAFAEAGRVLGDEGYLQIAQSSANFMLTALSPDGCLRRAWRLGLAGKEVFLEDYAALILGLLELYQTDFNNRWFTEACRLADEMILRFSDPQGGFFDTPIFAETLLTRPKDLQDNATPSGNALAAEALFRLAALTGKADWRELAGRSLGLVAGLFTRYPTAFARWLCVADFSMGSVKQVAVLGDPVDLRTAALIRTVQNSYHPNLVIAASSLPLPDGAPALLADRQLIECQPTAYVCEGFICRLPVTSSEELSLQLAE